MLHVRRVPRHLAATLHERGAKFGVAAAVADVPLAAGDDLQRPAAAFVELHRVGDRARLTDRLTGRRQLLDDLLLRLSDGQPGDRGVRLGRHAGRRGRQDPPVAADDRPHLERQLAPPRDVRGVTERADHRDARPLVGLRQLVGDDGDLDAVQRRAHRRAEQRLVALVVGMGNERDARGHQLGAGCVDLDVTCAIGAVERELVVRAGPFAVLDLGLCDRCTVVDVPQRWRFLQVGLAAPEVAQERALAGAPRPLVDRRVQVRPVVRQSEPAEHGLEDLLVDRDQLVAELDEVRPRDRHRPVILGDITAEWRLEALVVLLRRIAAHSVVVLHPSLGGQSVVVPPDRVEDGLAAHPLEPSDDVGVGVAEHVAHVQRPAHGRRWGVDREHLRTRRRSVETVDVVGPPPVDPVRLDAVERRLVGDVRHGRPGYGMRPRAVLAVAVSGRAQPASGSPRRGTSGPRCRRSRPCTTTSR